jgi:hypothetical protein
MPAYKETMIFRPDPHWVFGKYGKSRREPFFLFLFENSEFSIL